MTKFIGIRLSKDDSDIKDWYQGLEGNKSETIKRIIRKHINGHTNGVPQGVVDALIEYLNDSSLPSQVGGRGEEPENKKPIKKKKEEKSSGDIQSKIKKLGDSF